MKCCDIPPWLISENYIPRTGSIISYFWACYIYIYIYFIYIFYLYIFLYKFTSKSIFSLRDKRFLLIFHYFCMIIIVSEFIYNLLLIISSNYTKILGSRRFCESRHKSWTKISSVYLDRILCTDIVLVSKKKYVISIYRFLRRIRGISFLGRTDSHW